MGSQIRGERRCVGPGVLCVGRRQWHLDAGGLGLQLVERQAARRQLLAVGGLDVTIPEVLEKTEVLRQAEDNLGVRARLANRRHHGVAILHQGLCTHADLEAEPHRLALEARGYRQHDVGERRRR